MTELVASILAGAILLAVWLAAGRLLRWLRPELAVDPVDDIVVEVDLGAPRRRARAMATELRRSGAPVSRIRVELERRGLPWDSEIRAIAGGRP